MNALDTAQDRLTTWLDSRGLDVVRVTALPGDVSPRRYFRIATAEGTSYVGAAYPIPVDDAAHRFLKTTVLFADAGIRVPEVHASDPAGGLVLLEDLGTVSLFDLASSPWSHLRPLVEEAAAFIGKLAERPQSPFSQVNVPLGASRLALELDDARSVFLDRPQFSGADPEKSALITALEALVATFQNEPMVPTHRDFMSRNLMVPADRGTLAVIDHQDACLAPRGYDLASLLNDSLLLTDAQERPFLEDLQASEILTYRRCAVQRCLKASATFIRFARRGFGRHLNLVAPSLARAAMHLERLPEGRDVPASLLERWRDTAAVARGIDGIDGIGGSGAKGVKC